MSESVQSINVNNHNKSLELSLILCFLVLFLVLKGLRGSINLFICIKLQVS